MGTSTTKLKLYKPATIGENVSVSDLNANMDKIEDLLPYKECTSGARPGSPFLGQMIFETDTKKTYIYTGTAWKWVPYEDLGFAANQQTGLKNILHNGDFRVAQRGGTAAVGSGTGVNSSGVDRWYCLRGSFATGATWSRTASGLPPNGPVYGLKLQRDSGNASTQALIIRQAIESMDIYRARGKYLTLSFWARCGANYSPASSLLNVQIVTGTGTDESSFSAYTGSVTDLSQTPTLTTSWQKFTYTTASPIGTSVAEAQVAFSANVTGTASTNDWFEIAGVQLEEGLVATAFEYLPYQTEYQRCLRYYFRQQSAGANEEYCSAYANTTTNVRATLRFPVPMRTGPSMAGSTAFSFQNAGATLAASAIAFFNADQYAVNIGITVAGATAGAPGNLISNASTTAYIEASAEL